MIRVKNKQDLAAGLFLLVVAALAWWFGLNLPIGSAMRMGPGYFPRLITVVIAVLGVLIILRSLHASERRLEPWAPKLLVLVLGSVGLFALAIERFGLVAAASALVLLASAAWPQQRWRGALIFACCLVTFVILIFSVGLGLSIKVWPW